jgi:succinylglutamate desuccinylase
MDYNKFIIGEGKPRLAVVTCLHGDEIVGKKIFKTLRTLSIDHGSILVILANPHALKLKRRFVKKDLNRSFPGRVDGVFEERLAVKILNDLKDIDFVIDLHATNSKIDSLIIITETNKMIRRQLDFLCPEKVALIRKKVFGGQELIANVKAGASLEYGPDKSGRNYQKIMTDLLEFFQNAGHLKGQKRKFLKKSYYEVSGQYAVDKGFVPNKNLDDFKFISRGEKIGRLGKKDIVAKDGFYPVFLGKGRYKKTLCLVARKVGKLPRQPRLPYK